MEIKTESFLRMTYSVLSLGLFGAERKKRMSATLSSVRKPSPPVIRPANRAPFRTGVVKLNL